MIVFELICPDQHRFEGWFASAEDFDHQRAHGLLECPTCGRSAIEKLLTAKIGKSEGALVPAQFRDGDRREEGARAAGSAVSAAARPQQVMPTAQQLQKVVDYLLANSENVGSQFAEEARRIHREEAPARSIRGVASREETEELLDEGIPVMPLPVPPQGDWH